MEQNPSEFIRDLKITIENPKGSYKSFEIEGDPISEKYPLKGVTYPVDYGSVEDYLGEDGADLDVFTGTGEECGLIRVSRLDVPSETKFFIRVTEEEIKAIESAFAPVLLETKILNEEECVREIGNFKNPQS